MPCLVKDMRGFRVQVIWWNCIRMVNTSMWMVNICMSMLSTFKTKDAIWKLTTSFIATGINGYKWLHRLVGSVAMTGATKLLMNKSSFLTNVSDVLSWVFSLIIWAFSLRNIRCTALLSELSFEHQTCLHTTFSMQQAHRLVIGHCCIQLYYIGSCWDQEAPRLQA